MIKDLPSKLAVLLHADVAGSTELVRSDEALTHQRIVHAFRRFSETISNHDGETLGVWGDALLAEFSKPSTQLFQPEPGMRGVSCYRRGALYGS